MAKELQVTQFKKLMNDISNIYERSVGEVNKILNKARWDIGRMIVEQQQNGLERAPYGEDLIEGLSAELTKKYGSGFSETNLKNMRKFYTIYPKSQRVDELAWGILTLLLTIDDEEYRRELHDKALKEGLTREAMRLLIQEKMQITKSSSNEEENNVKTYKMDETRGHLHAYILRASKLKTPLHTGSDVDLGFKMYHPLDRQLISRFSHKQIIQVKKKDDDYSYLSSDLMKNEIFTYVAFVERVTDGDTLLLHIDLGFGMATRQHVRLAGFNAPERDTKEGQRVKRFVQNTLKNIDFVIVKTFVHDQYSRYLANVYFLPEEKDPQIVVKNGILLNRLIMDEALGK